MFLFIFLDFRAEITFDFSVKKYFVKQHVPLFCILNCRKQQQQQKTKKKRKFANFRRNNLFFVAPALAGRYKRTSFRPFVRPSVRQHLTWVSCERNSSYSFAPIVLKLCMCVPHGMRMCMWIGHNCWINFCHFFDIVNLVIFHPDYIDRGYLL